MSLIDETGDRKVRMAHLATIGSHAMNGVAALHSDLLKQAVLRDFAEMFPERFLNVTNGVTPRRFLMLSNPGLARLLDESIGTGWSTDLAQLDALAAHADDAGFHEAWRAIRRENKTTLTGRIKSTGIDVDTNALFDIQVKRIHEYKRQYLNALYIINLYRRLCRNPDLDKAPRCFIYGGKAAPGYAMAKLIIRLITGIVEVVNNDAAIKERRFKVIFYPDFNVKNGYCIYPAADLSEQISTAGKEASGTGNMKLMMNGALTIGTLDGANVEIHEEAGAENFFLFGLTAQQVGEVKRAGYRPAENAQGNDDLRDSLDQIAEGRFSRGDKDMFRPLVDNLMQSDPFLVLADFADYVSCQERVSDAWRDARKWTRMSIMNTARSCKFPRTVRSGSIASASGKRVP
jgi:starch phosphorylase